KRVEIDFEQRVVRQFYLVKYYVLVKRVEPEGERVRNEVDLVPAGRKLLAQLGRNNAASAVRGVARNTYIHNLQITSSAVMEDCRAGNRTCIYNIQRRMDAVVALRFVLRFPFLISGLVTDYRRGHSQATSDRTPCQSRTKLLPVLPWLK